MFNDHLCYIRLLFVMLTCLFTAALWSPGGKGLTSWLSFVMFIVFLSFSHVVSWVRCGNLNVSNFDLCQLSYLTSNFFLLCTNFCLFCCFTSQITALVMGDGQFT